MTTDSNASTPASGGTRFPCFDRPWTERCPCGDDPSLGEGCPLSKPHDPKCIDCGGVMTLVERIHLVDEPNDIYECGDCGTRVHVHVID